MIGYHYTSLKNWREIEAVGYLRPYRIQKPEFFKFFPNGVDGIWLWQNDLEGASHAGSILFQLGSKGDPSVVKLKVQYDKQQLLTCNGDSAELTHNGDIGAWKYHTKEWAVIITGGVSVGYIDLLKIYDVVKLLK